MEDDRQLGMCADDKYLLDDKYYLAAASVGWYVKGLAPSKRPERLQEVYFEQTDPDEAENHEVWVEGKIPEGQSVNCGDERDIVVLSL